jgi:hypothetical protein
VSIAAHPAQQDSSRDRPSSLPYRGHVGPDTVPPYHPSEDKGVVSCGCGPDKREILL